MLTAGGLGEALILMQDAECIKRLHLPLSGDGWSHTPLEPPGVYNTDCYPSQFDIFPLRSSDTCMCSYACAPYTIKKKSLKNSCIQICFPLMPPFRYWKLDMSKSKLFLCFTFLYFFIIMLLFQNTEFSLLCQVTTKSKL